MHAKFSPCMISVTQKSYKYHPLVVHNNTAITATGKVMQVLSAASKDQPLPMPTYSYFVPNVDMVMHRWDYFADKSRTSGFKSLTLSIAFSRSPLCTAFLMSVRSFMVLKSTPGEVPDSLSKICAASTYPYARWCVTFLVGWFKNINFACRSVGPIPERIHWECVHLVHGALGCQGSKLYWHKRWHQVVS